MKSQASTPSGAIVGVGGSSIHRNEHVSLTSLCIDAALDAVADAGLAITDIDTIVGIPTAPNNSALHADGYDEVTAFTLANALGLRSPTLLDVAIENLVVGSIAVACQAVATRSSRRVLVVRGLFQAPNEDYAARPSLQAAGAAQFMDPYGIGATGPIRHALLIARLLHEMGWDRRDLYPVVRAGRQAARLNPLAYWRSADIPTLEEYLNTPSPFLPLSILDCDLPVSGATAFVVAPAEDARHFRHSALVTGFVTAARAPTLFDVAGVSRSEVDVCQLYDGFSYFVLQTLESLELCKRGQAPRFISDGNTALTGSLPVNTFGGSLGEGRLHGGGHVREAALQIMGRAGDRQVHGARHCIVNNGLSDRGWFMMLSAR